MGLENFIPTIWSARLLANMEKKLVYAQTGIVNRDYEGEITGLGCAVKINAIGPVTIGEYTKNTDIAAPEVLNSAQAMLEINQAKYFNFAIDSIDKAQQQPKLMNAAMAKASHGLRDKADQYVASLYTQVAAANQIGSDAVPIVPTKTTAYEYLVDMAVILTENNVPTEGRWVIVPAWFYGLLLKDDRFVKAGTSASDEALRNGQVGEAAGFTVLQSNNMPNTAGTKYKILAGTSAAISYAEQIVDIQAYMPERRFGDAVKGLHVYGAKVVLPDGLALLTANKS